MSGIAAEQADAALVAAARAGDRGALETLLRRHHDRIHALCRRVTSNEADAADATQEALIAIVRGLARYDGRASFTTWSYRIAVNSSLDELRRRRRRGVLGLPEESAASDGPGLEAAAVERLDVDRAMSKVPLGFRAAVVLRDLCGLDYAEIAEVLDIPPGTVRSRIARGRATLAEELSGNPQHLPRRQKPMS